MIPSDVLVIPGTEGRWIVMNVRARTAIALDTAGLDALRAVEQTDVGQVVAELGDRRFRFWGIGRFASRSGLLADPTPFVRDASNWQPADLLDVGSLIDRCRAALVLIDDLDAYTARFAPKDSVLDWYHLGNFHQHLGQQLLLVERADPAEWWVQQKFSDDGTIRPNLYHSVQELFLERFFQERVTPGIHVLDIGCGTGLYADRMASRGASVLGVDPNPRYIELARSRSRHGARFEQMRVGEIGGLDGVAANSMDMVFMSDALLFYFHPAVPNQRVDLDELVRSVHRILRRGGTFVSMEPHPVFWLAPWLGEVDRPFTVVTEYAHRQYGVTPTVSELINAIASRGFAIVDLAEVTAGEVLPGDRGTHFAAEFPLWQVVQAKIL